ncbi:MAG: transaldolase [Phycisphaerales bacterium]|nr:MAG: transaldolase [Phycisphaerales bacterium]
MTNKIEELYGVGQSIWCDNISRGMLNSGELKRWIDLGVSGVTSNPSIFLKAITGGTDYDERFNKLLADGLDTAAIYEGLVIPDIADAADALRPVYESTKGIDGYVSLEVDPKLAYDTEATISEGRRLFNQVNRRNLLIKVPATEEGMPAVETLLAEGVNVNVTLIFGIDVYEKVMQAYTTGLRRYGASGGDMSVVASVASLFVSRVDTMVDKLLEEKKAAGAKVDHLFGKAAIANAKLAYARFEEFFGSNGEFAALAAHGARVQRPVWASTSTKNPNYPDTMYLDGLIAPHTVNTLPPNVIEATLDHGMTDITIDEGLEEDRRLLAELSKLGIDLTQVTNELRTQGVDLFAKSFEDLITNLNQKKQHLHATS